MQQEKLSFTADYSLFYILELLSQPSDSSLEGSFFNPLNGQFPYENDAEKKNQEWD